MRKTHAAHHKRLHNALDELVADYLRHHPNQQLGEIHVRTLLDWSHSQVNAPTEPRDTNGHHNGKTFDHPKDRHP